MFSNNKNVAELADQAQKLLDSGDFSDSLKAINRAISILPRNIDLHSLKSDILFQSGDFEEAIKELKFIETLDPDNASYYSMESLCYLQLGEDKKALESANKAIKVDKDYVFSYYNRARALNNLGRTDEAISAYNLYLEKNPSDPDAHRDLGKLYFDAKKYKMAERELKLALRFNKNDEMTYDLMLKLKLETNDAKGFVNTFVDTFENTGNTNYITRLTDMLLDNGYIDNAETIANGFYNYNSDNLDLASNLAKVYYADKKYNKGNNVFDEYIERNNNIEANEEYIEMLLGTSQHDLALSIIDNNIKKYPDDEDFVFYKFQALSDKGDHASALPVIKTLYEKHLDSIQYGINYAIELSYNGIKDEALNILNSMSKLNTELKLEYAYYTVYANLGLYDKAIEYLYKGIEAVYDMERISDILTLSIDNSIENNYYEKIINALDDLSSKEGNAKSILCNIGKACILSAIDKTEEATRILDGISRDYVCMIISQYMDFENSKIMEFLSNYFNRHCKNSN